MIRSNLISLRVVPAAVIAAALCLCLSPAFAKIAVSGLEDTPALKSYIEDKVLPAFNDRDKDDPAPYPATIKAQLKKAAKALGYYNPKVTNDPATPDTYLITPGPLYTISLIDVTGYSPAPPLKLAPGSPLMARDVLSAQKKIITTVSDDNCFYKLAIKNRVFLDQSAHMADVFFDVTASDQAKFGATTLTGAPNIDQDYLQKFIKYHNGDCWKATELEDTKNALLKTGLISTINVTLPEDVPADGLVPVAMELKERAPRKVRLGANYSTSEGPGVLAEWLHRNFFGSGEELSVSTQISGILQKVGLDFKKPFFLTDKQSFSFTSSLQREETDAYDELGINASAAIERELSRFWSASLGVGLNLLQITEEGESTNNYALVSFPAKLNYDSRDDVLNPKKGYTLRLLAAPFIDAIGTTAPFVKTRATGTTYIGLGKSLFDSVIALRASIGSILGTETQDIPASQRFYAGGGGSIRGYGYQEAGPIDAQNDPSGGRSIIETTTELRLKFNNSFGGAVFVDAGGVSDSAFPDLKGGTYIGAGVGVRYYTDFGPIRFDVAVPLTQKDDLDQGYQFYISIGQAF